MSTTITESAAETEALGARLAANLAPGEIVVVSGELGAGKTTLIRGAAADRLADLSAEEPWLLDDYLTDDAVAFVEWPEAAGDLPIAARVRIEHVGGDRRRVTVERIPD